VLYDAARINKRTAAAYEQLLVNLRIVESVPAWTANRLKRLVSAPKRYLVDAALLAGVLRLDVNGVMRDGNLLGRVVDTFVTSQLRASLATSRSRARLYHLRDQQGRHEIDLLGELGGQRVVGVEIKADAAPQPDAGNHLGWLRDRIGERFVAGVVLHTGTRTYPLTDGVVAAPIATLWS
jgi:predicted AAA+ superfamily ATPase